MSARQKEILGSLVLAGLICAVGFGDDIQRQDESVQINPALKVIKRLYVAVEPGQVDLNELSGWDVLKKKIEKRLKDAGIAVADAAYTAGSVEAKEPFESVSVFTVTIDKLKLSGFRESVYRVESSVMAETFLQTNPPHLLKLKVWSICGTGYAGSEQASITMLMALALTQADSFIKACNEAKAPADSEAVTAGIQDGGKLLPSKIKSDAPKYVASKKSKVFHRPDCIWAAKISPKNLVVYKTKAQAIKAGKRPCKRCNP